MTLFRVQIRCCCNADKLMGTVLTERKPRVGDVMAFILYEDPLPYIREGRLLADCPTLEVVHLPVGLYREPHSDTTYFALKSEEIPLEKLKKIKTFEAAEG